MKLINSVIIILLLISVNCLALDRCQDYISDVRTQHIQYFGLSYPYWYGVGQLRQESNCRSNITAFDGGMGVAQFMPATAKDVSQRLGLKLDPYNIHDATKMQAYYMSQVHKGNKISGKPLWATYQAYNGGWKLLYAESQRASSSNHDDMKLQCHRKVLTLSKGRKLSLCEVNYDYSIKIAKYAKKYQIAPDGMRYW